MAQGCKVGDAENGPRGSHELRIAQVSRMSRIKGPEDRRITGTENRRGGRSKGLRRNGGHGGVLSDNTADWRGMRFTQECSARRGRRRACAGFRKASAERTTLMGWKADSGERQRLAWYNSLARFRGRFGMPFETPDGVVDSAKEPVLERSIRLRGHAKCDAGGEKVECPLYFP